MKVVITIFLVIVTNLCTFAGNEFSDTVKVKIDWKGMKFLRGNDGKNIQTIDASSAIHLPEYNHLPVIELKTGENEILSLELVDWESDSLSEAETKIFQERNTHFQTFKTRVLTFRNKVESSFLFFPFIYDSLNHHYVKINKAEILVRSEKSAQDISTRRKSLRVSNSVLSTGSLYKIAVVENGVYKLDRDFLRGLGLDVDRLDPSKIKIFGNGGGVLPQENSAFRHEDLYENAIFVSGENDGSFDEGDEVLFYGQQQHKIWLNEEGEISYSHNIYSDTTYYFISVDGTDGKRINTIENLAGQFPIVDSYNDLQFHEVNDITIINSGREWFGEKFDAIVYQNVQFDTRDIRSGSEIKVVASALCQSEEPTTMEFSLNDQEIGIIEFTNIPDGAYFTKGILETEEFVTDQSQNMPETSVVSMKFNKINGIRSTAYLNFLNFSCVKELTTYDAQLIFRSLQSIEQSNSTFSITNLSQEERIWNITQPLNPQEQQFSVSGKSFSTETNSLQEYVVFNPGNLKIPIANGPVENQNIRGESVPDLIIVSHPLFLSEARRLADHRRSFDGLDVLVVIPQQVFNEFSSGSQDVTAIRDMARFFYLKGNGAKLKNLLLFGKTSFDYKDRIKNNTNFVPTYNSRNSVHPVYSYTSDDYYGFFDEDEGEWEESFSGDHTMEIGVGRLPVKALEEARTLVNKLINYSKNPETLGEWRNDIFFIADDGDANIHQRDADKLATYVDTTYTRFNAHKIYVDAFEQEVTQVGETAPEANETINNSIAKGGLIFNFTGHGSEIRWCSETILDLQMVNQWKNFDKLPLFVTATCEFGKHDDPRLISGGEQLLLNRKGGAIGLVTTSRPVYSNSNYDINYAFYRSVFELNNNEFQDLGSVFKNTKNRSLRGSNNRNFCLLGDPSMKLAVAKHNIQIQADMDTETKIPGDTLGSLELVKIKGNIVGLNGADMPSYNGILTATVFDKKIETQTLGNEGSIFHYKIRNSIIFNGNVSISEGKFNLEFVVPKSLSEDFDKGKVSLYAKSDNPMNDAAGADLSFYIGGEADSEPDNTPPEIGLFINDTTFQNLGITGSDIIALAKISDENGINTLNDELNEGIILRLDNLEFKYVGNFFKSELDTYQSGWLNYPISELEEGYHTIVIGAYDTHNNYSEKEIEFYVTNSQEFYAEKLLNYPNPFKDFTTFTFQHNRAGDDLELNLKIFDIQGRIVFNGSQIVEHSPGKIDDLTWNGQSFSGKQLEPGVYVYMIKIRSLEDNSNYFLKSKLLIIN